MNMKKKWAAAAILPALLWAGTTFAFSDLSGDPAEAKILSLKQAGVVSGVNDSDFAPQGKLTNAEGVQMIVNGFHLNLDRFRFIKIPEASDYFTQVPNDVWYSQAFINAHLNGLSLANGIIPGETMTREQYAHLLHQAVMSTGEYPVTMQYIIITDESSVTKEYMDSIQTLLKMRIANLDSTDKFRPKDVITRSEAADMLYESIRFVKEMEERTPVPAPATDTPSDSDSSPSSIPPAGPENTN